MGLDELPMKHDDYTNACMIYSEKGTAISIVYYHKTPDFGHGQFEAGQWYVWTDDTYRSDILKPLDPLMAQCLIYHYMSL